MELTPEEKERIYLEEKARIEAQERIRAEADRRTGKPSKKDRIADAKDLIIAAVLFVVLVNVVFPNWLTNPFVRIFLAAILYIGVGVVRNALRKL